MTMPLLAENLFKCLSDETRLRCIMLLSKQGELCVCQLTAALELSQPKISRHLAQLRQTGLLVDKRVGQWVYYKLNPELPAWAFAVLIATAQAVTEKDIYQQDLYRLRTLLTNKHKRCD